MTVNKGMNTINMSLTNQQNNAAVRRGDMKNSQGKEKSNSVYAGNLNLIEDSIADKEVKAQKEAMKAILDTFNGELELDAIQENHGKNAKNLEKSITEIEDKLKGIEGEKANLTEKYNVDPNSQEQKDLELLQKYNGKTEELTEEENERLLNMGPLTEYQTEVLNYDEITKDLNKDLKNIEKKINQEKGSKKGLELARLESNPMTDAKKSAKKILEDASKEIIDMVQSEAKDHIDEEMDKDIEEAEKIAEEIKEKYEDSDDSEDSIQQEILKEAVSDLEQMSEAEIDSVQIEAQLKSIMKKLPKDDIKGIKVDAKA